MRYITIINFGDLDEHFGKNKTRLYMELKKTTYLTCRMAMNRLGGQGNYGLLECHL